MISIDLVLTAASRSLLRLFVDLESCMNQISQFAECMALLDDSYSPHRTILPRGVSLCAHVYDLALKHEADHDAAIFSSMLRATLEPLLRFVAYCTSLFFGA